MKEMILGFNIENCTVSECVNAVFRKLVPGDRSRSTCAWLGCLNPHSYAVSVSDLEFRAALLNADWLIPDGVGVVYASRVLGGRIGNRITGADLFLGLLERMNQVGGKSVFFLGSTDKTLGLIKNRVKVDYPNVRVAGTFSPSFNPEYSVTEINQMIKAVNESGADVLWVGMTAPKQEKWLYLNRSRLHVKFAAAIGAVFDFYSGEVKRSHPTFQRLGLEWLPRLARQPRRLWQRMFVSAPIFCWHVILARVGFR